MDQSHFALIDELDQTVSRHVNETQMMQGDDWTSDWSLHLQHELQISFMNVAVRFGLHEYVRIKLDHGFEETEASNGQQFLSYAVNPRPIAYRYPLKSKMVSLLLEHRKTRADPNMSMIGQSPWQEALTYVFEQSYGSFYKPRENERLEQIEIPTLLLIFGANPKAVCKTRAGLMSASDIVDKFLKDCSLPQALELKNFLATRVAEEEEDFIPNHRQTWSFWRWIMCI